MFQNQVAFAIQKGVSVYVWQQRQMADIFAKCHRIGISFDGASFNGEETVNFAVWLPKLSIGMFLPLMVCEFLLP